MGLILGRGKTCFLFFTASRPAPEPIQSPNQCIREKRPEREDNYSLLTITEVKNAWSYTYTLPYVFMTQCLIKHRTCLHGGVTGQAQGHLHILSYLREICREDNGGE
jgi:hypothetical protein